MRVKKRIIYVTMATFLSAAAVFADDAKAVVIVGAPTLPDPQILGVLELSDIFYSTVLTGPGVGNLGPMIIPGEGYRNYGTGIIAAQYGSDPSVFLSANPANGGGGDSSLNMYYTVQYNAPTLLPGTLVLTQVTASETVNQVGLSAASATMIVSGPTGDIYVGYDCAAAAGAAFGCASTAAPFGNELVVMEANVPYTVELSLEIYAHGNVLAEIDPRFSASASYGGQFVFSPGITAGVPEPSTWAMMLIGFAGLGFAAYRQSKKGTAACGIV